MEDELPFFAFYSSMMASAGVTLYEAMRRLIGRGIYRRLENDAVYLVRSVEFMGEDQDVGPRAPGALAPIPRAGGTSSMGTPLN